MHIPGPGSRLPSLEGRAGPSRSAAMRRKHLDTIASQESQEPQGSRRRNSSGAASARRGESCGLMRGSRQDWKTSPASEHEGSTASRKAGCGFGCGAAVEWDERALVVPRCRGAPTRRRTRQCLVAHHADGRPRAHYRCTKRTRGLLGSPRMGYGPMGRVSESRRDPEQSAPPPRSHLRAST